MLDAPPCGPAGGRPARRGVENNLNLARQQPKVAAMKFALLLGCLLGWFAARGSDPRSYHGDWNDLNKNGRKDLYEDPAQPIEKRVADLLARMTLDEKIGQLIQAHREADAEQVFGDRLRHGRVGSFLDGSELIETPGPRNLLQRIAVEHSRLGIPLIFGHDSIHGFRTIFPIPLAMACAWEPELFTRCQTISARETAAVGIDWTFAPMVDLARDPRWGRIAEGFGEDPWLGALYAAACVRGFQGTNPAAPDRLVACLKHYVGYGAAEGGRDYNTTEISEYTLRNFYLPQFKAGRGCGRLDGDERIQLSLRRSRERQPSYPDGYPARGMEVSGLRGQRLDVGGGAHPAWSGGGRSGGGPAGIDRGRGHGDGFQQLRQHPQAAGEGRDRGRIGRE